MKWIWKEGCLCLSKHQPEPNVITAIMADTIENDLYLIMKLEYPAKLILRLLK